MHGLQFSFLFLVVQLCPAQKDLHIYIYIDVTCETQRSQMTELRQGLSLNYSERHENILSIALPHIDDNKQQKQNKTETKPFL